jgi:hypothetical protein
VLLPRHQFSSSPELVIYTDNDHDPQGGKEDTGIMYPSGSISPCHLKRGMNADKPVKGPVWQTDEVEILLSKNGVHAHRKY